MIVGPGEFWADEGKPPVNDSELRRSLYAADNVLRAYERLNAQGIYVSMAAQSWLDERAGALPANYVLAENLPVTRFVPFHGKSIALVYLPEAGREKPAKLFKAALAAGRGAGEQADLVIGISPWGSKLERDFMAEAEGIYHIVLGGGKGYGFASTASGGAQGILWARPEEQGRSVNVIEIFGWPDKSAHVWMQGVNFYSSLKSFGANIPSDPVVMEIFPEKK